MTWNKVRQRDKAHSNTRDSTMSKRSRLQLICLWFPHGPDKNNSTVSFPNHSRVLQIYPKQLIRWYWHKKKLCIAQSGMGSYLAAWWLGRTKFISHHGDIVPVCFTAWWEPTTHSHTHRHMNQGSQSADRLYKHDQAKVANEQLLRSFVCGFLPELKL